MNESIPQFKKRAARSLADLGWDEGSRLRSVHVLLGVRAYLAARAVGSRLPAREVLNSVLTSETLGACAGWQQAASRYQVRMCVKFLVGEGMPVPIVALMTGCRDSTIRHHARSMRVRLPSLHWGKRASH